MLDVASIANLKCLRVMNELTAAALGYGISKTDLPDHSVNSVNSAPLQLMLDNANVSIIDVDAVEMIGGRTRIPLIKSVLAKFFGGSLDGENKLSTTLNQDEALARGCALQCAILSPVFNVCALN
jgi:heat shock protein 4